MNQRHETTICCGTCDKWDGERKKIEKENISANTIKVYVNCGKEGVCSYNNCTKKNDSKCKKYTRWNEL